MVIRPPASPVGIDSSAAAGTGRRKRIALTGYLQRLAQEEGGAGGGGAEAADGGRSVGGS